MLSPKKKKFDANKKYQLKVLNHGRLYERYTMYPIVIISWKHLICSAKVWGGGKDRIYISFPYICKFDYEIIRGFNMFLSTS